MPRLPAGENIDPLPIDLHLKEMRADGRFHAKGLDLFPTPLPPARAVLPADC